MTKKTPKEQTSKEAAYPVFEFEQRHNGDTIKLYNGIIKADELVDRYVVPEYKTGSDSGYQRPVYPSRLNAIASYVLSKEGVMPTSVLVNIRSGAVYHPKGDSFGFLSIPVTEPFWVVDGQHRTKGLKIAKERKQPLPYALPIVFSINLSEEQEMDLFYVVNSTQKSVPTDLTFEIMRKRIDRKASRGETTSITELRRFAAVEVARTLALNPKTVWFNKVQMADEVKQRSKPIRLAGLAKTIEPFLSSDWAHNLVLARDTTQLCDVVRIYWDGIRLLAQAAVDDPKEYSIQSPTGAWVFGWVLRDMVRFADKADNWTAEFFADQLKVLEEWVESQTWHRETGDDLTKAKGAGVARLIFEKIHPLYSTPQQMHFA